MKPRFHGKGNGRYGSDPKDVATFAANHVIHTLIVHRVAKKVTWRRMRVMGSAVKGGDNFTMDIGLLQIDKGRLILT